MRDMQAPLPAAEHGSTLQARRLGLFAQDEAIVLMRTDCHVCRSEGLSARSRVLLSAKGGEAIATLYQVEGDWLGADEAGLSEAAWKQLGVANGDFVSARHAPAVESFADVRRLSLPKTSSGLI